MLLHWNSLIVQEHVIVEAILNGGAVAEASAVHPLHGFSQDVGAGVPVHLWGSGVEERERTIAIFFWSLLSSVSEPRQKSNI